MMPKDEIGKLTNLNKKDRKKFFKLILKNRKNWKKKWKFSKTLSTDLQNKKTPQLLARMLYGECTAKSCKDQSKNRNEMLALWQVVKNSCVNLNQETIKKELLAKNRYESITGQSEKRTIGLRPEYNINWARAVIIATMFQKGKTNKLKKAPGISDNIHYFYAKNYFYGSKKRKV